MAVQSLTTTSSTQVDLGTGDDFYLGFSGELFHNDDAIIAESGLHELSLHGTVTAFNGSAVDLDDGQTIEIVIGQTGALISNGLATIEIYADYTVAIANAGSIFTTGSYGVFNHLYTGDGDTGVEFSLINTGTIQAASSVTGYSAVRSVAGTDTNRIQNDGTIIGNDQGIRLDSENVTSGANIILNSGLIEGTQEAIWIDGGALRLNNSGTIHGEVHTVGGGAAFAVNSGIIEGDFYTSTEDDVIRNAGGTITGEVNTNGGNDTVINAGMIGNAVLMFAGDDMVINSGQILGDVETGSNDDEVYNSGTISGNVDLGYGNDTFFGYGGTVSGEINGFGDNNTYYVDQAGVEIRGGSGQDTVYARGDVVALEGVEFIYLEGSGDISARGDLGANSIEGNVGANHIIGDEGNDTINGRGGDDIIEGWADEDVLRGGDGADYMDGGTYDDTLNGNEGDDTLIGGHGDDLLVGSVGDDRLVGGEGGDIIKGGAGADTFVYEATTDSVYGGAYDRIVGFTSGTDQIDLFDIYDDAFDYLGTGAFTGSGAMELRYTVSGAGHALVDLDANGDGTADMRIVLLYVDSLTEGDFIL